MSHTTLKEVLAANIKLTPMMEQYTSIKKNYDDHILFFRMGDFYEVFFDDAVATTKMLNITLTHRGKVGNFPIPMAGIPHHAATTYIDRLTSQGQKVAICEQIQDPKDAVGIVKRAVTQVASPGLPYDLDKTEGSEQNYITTAIKKENQYYLVAIDFTTGEFCGSIHQDKASFINKLSLYCPKELITCMGQWDDDQEISDALKMLGTLKTYLSADYFDQRFTALYCDKLIPGHQGDHTLKTHHELLSPIGAIAYYICSTQQLDNFFHIKPFRLLSSDWEMKVTLPTLRGLEIIPRSKETYKESLLGFMDRTQTALGTRYLRKLFIAPLYEQKEIEQRQSSITYFISNIEKLEEARALLSPVRDLERILAKVSTNKATASDLINIDHAITAYENLDKMFGKDLIHIFNQLKPTELKVLLNLQTSIQKTINDEIGATLDKGNLIKKGCDKKRDRLANLRVNAEVELSQIEKNYRLETGIQKLRVKSNNVAGYFIEISKSHTSKAPEHFIRKQTLVNCERFTTDLLKDFEKEMFSAKEKLERLEREIFKNLLSNVGELSQELQRLADTIAHLDALQSLAWVSYQEDFTKPIFVKEKTLKLTGVWHPIIKRAIKDQFVAHDLNLNKDVFFGLITGPNMAGKTTLMREVAIVQLLAQVGSYVPAASAKISLCDFLFSRLGASDDILKGQSTFMVEMAETAEIVRHATEHSLIILDEVGRGTSTYDGLSIAWALIEHLVHNTKALGLFATHYHELIEVIDNMPQAKNLTVEIKSDGNDVQFLYRLIEEGAGQSYGIYVAKLAGLPKSLLHRSQEILSSLETSGNETPTKTPDNSGQLNFFPEQVAQIPPYLQELEQKISALDLNNMTPLETMRSLESIQQLLH